MSMDFKRKMHCTQTEEVYSGTFIFSFEFEAPKFSLKTEKMKPKINQFSKYSK